MQSTHQSTSRFSSVCSTLTAFYLLSVACALGILHPLTAETSEAVSVKVPDPRPNYSFDDFKGIWLTEIDGRAVYLLIQRNQIARYFYRTGIDNTVYQSRWQLDPERGLNVLDVASVRVHIDPKTESIRYGSLDQSSKIERVNSATLGDWARPPDYETPKNQYIPASYFGYWKSVSEADGRSFEVRKNRMVVALIPDVETSQTTETTEGKKQAGTSLLFGEWYKHGQQLHIAWEDGAYSIVDNSNPELVKLYDFRSGETIEETTGSFSILTQSLEAADREFLETMRSAIDKKSRISLQHLAQKTLLKFYRGDWIAYDGMQDQPYGILKFGRFGGVELRSNKGNLGTWYPSGKRCTLNFEDGTRMQFSPVGSGFLIFVYEATRPLDAYPNKVLSTAPLDRDKLTWLQTEPSYALNLLSQWAEVQSLNSENTVSFESLPNPRNYSNLTNPWWWPIWNDNPHAISANSADAVEALDTVGLSENNPSASLTNTGLSMASKESESDLESTRQEHSPRAEERFTPRADPWHWPF